MLSVYLKQRALRENAINQWGGGAVGGGRGGGGVGKRQIAGLVAKMGGGGIGGFNCSSSSP